MDRRVPKRDDEFADDQDLAALLAATADRPDEEALGRLRDSAQGAASAEAPLRDVLDRTAAELDELALRRLQRRARRIGSPVSVLTWGPLLAAAAGLAWLVAGPTAPSGAPAVGVPGPSARAVAAAQQVAPVVVQAEAAKEEPAAPLGPLLEDTELAGPQEAWPSPGSEPVEDDEVELALGLDYLHVLPEQADLAVGRGMAGTTP